IVRVDRDLRIRYINPAFRRITGIPEEQAIGCTPSELKIPKDLASALELKARFVFDTGREATLEFEYIGTKGRQFFHARTIPEHYENGHIVTLISTLHDVTALIETQEKLRESEERYRHIVETANEGIWTIDAENRTTFVNRRMAEMLGYAPEEMLGKTPFDFIPPDERKEQKKAFARRKRGIREQFEFRYVRKDKSIFWAIVSATPIWNSERNIIGAIAMVTDIADRKRAEDALRESEVRFRAAVENFPGVFKVYDPDRRIRYINVQGAALSGHAQDDIIGKRDEEYLPSDIVDSFIPVLNRAIDTKTPQSMENRLNFPSGERWFLANFIPLLDDKQNIWQILGTAVDITVRKKAEESVIRLNKRLRRQTIQLEATNKELESFSYSISHDLRAPLRSLDGFSQALEEDYADKLDEQARDYTSRIRAAAQRMARLIDDLLQLSRTTRAELNYTTVNLSEQAQSVIEELRQTEPGRKVEITIQEVIVAEGDETLLRQVLQNLLGNAWKFTSHREDARIEFGVKREENRKIYFVRDNGAGFDMQYAEDLFVPFRRMHSETEFPGSGIGLSTVKRIIDRHGGNIWAESEPGKGSTFYFTLGD
ncbi:MAG: sensor histidine kinase, partial [Candidatus Latescibacterota bacterium]